MSHSVERGTVREQVIVGTSLVTAGQADGAMMFGMQLPPQLDMVCHRVRRLSLPLVWVCGLSACAFAPATPEPVNADRPETLWAVTADHQLLQFKAIQPSVVVSQKPLQGLAAGEVILGMDYRVARGVLYALGSSGHLYTVDTAQARLQRVSAQPLNVSADRAYGVDFNPVVDRIRVVDETGRNLRVHPDTGAQVDGDPARPGVQEDGGLHHVGTGLPQPRVAGMAYTYNTRDDKLTTGYAIDMAQGSLVTLGSAEGVTPVVSPNGGALFTVGSLGLGPLRQVSFDISDVRNVALAALSTQKDARSRLYQIDLSTGRATLLGTIGQGQALRGVAIEP